VDVRDQSLQRLLGPQRGEVRDLRLERAGEFRGGIGDVAAEAEHRIVAAGEGLGEFRRLRIEPHADK